ncbi:hypothetical protein BJX96DRAFT_183134 [Aspergillus floccosus]
MYFNGSLSSSLCPKTITREISDKSFVLSCSPSILRLDYFDVQILCCILAESLNSVINSLSLINVLETVSVVLHSEAARNYEFLREFLDKYLITLTLGPSKFFASTWPCLVSLALQLPSLFPAYTIPPFKSDEISHIILSRRQVACLVTEEAMHQGAVQAYLTALFIYFEAIGGDEPNTELLHHSVEDWPIIFTLMEMPESKSYSLFRNAPASLSCLAAVQLPHQSTDIPYLSLPDGACVISANKCVGIGATGTQEEFHVGISPEAYPVSLLALPLRDRQAFLDEVLHTGPRSSSANWRNRIMLFIDALELDLVGLAYSHGGESIPDLMPGYLHRELAKACTAFCSHYYGSIGKPSSFITTGHWGCGAFGGNKKVRAISQWHAASMANVPELRYILGGTEQKRFGDELIKRGLEPRYLFEVLVRLGKDIQNGKSCIPDPDNIFEYVLNCL